MILNKKHVRHGFFWTNYLFKRPDLVDDYQDEINRLYLKASSTLYPSGSADD
jgi:hypothetical protein